MAVSVSTVMMAFCFRERIDCPSVGDLPGRDKSQHCPEVGLTYTHPSVNRSKLEESRTFLDPIEDPRIVSQGERYDTTEGGVNFEDRIK
jgi:hypothetical protein